MLRALLDVETSLGRMEYCSDFSPVSLSRWHLMASYQHSVQRVMFKFFAMYVERMRDASCGRASAFGGCDMANGPYAPAFLGDVGLLAWT